MLKTFNYVYPGNLFILNIFWIVSCLPIVTIVPATTAMFSVVRQWQLHQDTSVVKELLQVFKRKLQAKFYHRTNVDGYISSIIF
jgi:uncharacterized membrane protein YesL